MFETILPVLILLIAVGGIAFFVIYMATNIKISKKTARRLELVGYGLLFAFIIWQFIIKNIVTKSFNDRDFYYIHQKLDTIARMLTANNEMAPNNYYNYYISLYEQMDNARLASQLHLIDIFEAALTLGSTVLIAFGRFHELLYKKKEASSNIRQDTSPDNPHIEEERV